MGDEQGFHGSVGLHCYGAIVPPRKDWKNLSKLAFRGCQPPKKACILFRRENDDHFEEIDLKKI